MLQDSNWNFIKQFSFLYWQKSVFDFLRYNIIIILKGESVLI